MPYDGRYWKAALSAIYTRIFIYEAEGLKHFNDFSSEKIDKLPTEEELENIAEEELSNLPSQIENSKVFPIFERGEVKYMYLPPGFTSPNHYIQYLRAFDSD
ncbi:hypothetical protein [Nostoc sp.]